MKPTGGALCIVAVLSLGATLPARGGQQTWTGRISDSACGAHHEEAAEGAGAISDRDCTLACVRGGSRYVLVLDSRVVSIANQQFAGLADHAGRAVTVTGSMSDGAITITTLEKRN